MSPRESATDCAAGEDSSTKLASISASMRVTYEMLITHDVPEQAFGVTRPGQLLAWDIIDTVDDRSRHLAYRIDRLYDLSRRLNHHTTERAQLANGRAASTVRRAGEHSGDTAA